MTSVFPVTELPDLLSRIALAIPDIREWVCGLHAAHSRAAVRVCSLDLPSLNARFPVELLHQTGTVTVPRVPFPPVSDFDLPEFEAMAQMDMAGITFGNMYFVQENFAAAEGVHVHEFVHVVQWQELGLRDFLLTYGLGIVQHGYAGAPLEQIAFGAQATFESGGNDDGLAERVRRHASSERDAAIEVYRSNGIVVR
jgi:hypothetical protein